MQDGFDARVESLFHRAADMPGEARAQFLREQCPDDGEVVARVEALLRHDELGRAGFLATGAPPDAAAPAAGHLVGTRVGPYTLLGVLGEGGMGTVYEAEEEHPRRKVALKLIRPGLLTPPLARRFRYEADVLARLDHPGVARVFHAGIADTPFGRQPYFAMELVRGVSLDRWLTRLGVPAPSLRDRMKLFLAICEAVQHAHAKGVVHRDLKPSNILIDGDGRPKVVDFGVARATDADVAATTLNTATGVVVGTLPYMAPEQAAGRTHDLDASADVYALGVIGYEMLSGRLPYEVRDRPLHEAVRAICEQEPTRLSTVDGTARGVRGDVETIVGKALEKDPARRYPTAGELAADVRRYLDYEPIAARPPGTWYQLRKFAARNRLLVGGVCALIVALSAGVVGTSLGIVHATRQRGLAETAGATARAERARAERLLAYSLVEQAQAWELTGAPARAWPVYGEAYAALTAAGEPTLAADIGLLQSYGRNPPPVADLPGHPDGVLSAAFTPDGRHLLTASRDATLKLWELSTGRVVHTLSGHRGWVIGCAVSPDGTRALSAGGDDLAVKLWDLATGRELRSLQGHTEPVRVVAFLPDGRRGVSSGIDGTLRLWDLEGGDTLRVLDTQSDGVMALAVSPDGTRVLAGTQGGRKAAIGVWDLNSNEFSTTLYPDLSLNTSVRAAAFLPDGRRVVTGGFSGNVRLTDLTTGKILNDVDMGQHVTTLALARETAGGTVVLAAGEQALVHLLDVESGKVLRQFAGNSGPARQATFSPDGQLVMVTGMDGRIRVWLADARRNRPAAASQFRPGSCIDYSPDGLLTFVMGSDGVTMVWDTHSGMLLGAAAAVAPTAGRFRRACFMGGGRWQLLEEPGLVRVLEFASGRQVFSLAIGRSLMNSFVWDPDRSVAVSGHQDGTIRVWDTRDGSLTWSVAACTRGIHATQLNADASLILVNEQAEPMVHVWDRRTGKKVSEVRMPGSGRGLAYSPDERFVVAADEVGTLRLFTADIKTELASFTGHLSMVLSATFSPDGKFIVSGGRDGTVRLWDIATARCVYSAHAEGQPHPRFDPNGNVLVDVRTSGTATRVGRVDPRDAARWREFDRLAPSARARLQSDPSDAAALLCLGQWYAFRGVDEWAVELLERARAAGGDVRSLDLARSHWKLGNLNRAAEEFRAALDRREAPPDYLNLCLNAVTNPPSTRPTTGPAGPPSFLH